MSKAAVLNWWLRATIDTGHPANVLRVFEVDAIDGLQLVVADRSSDASPLGCLHQIGITRATAAALRDELTRYLETTP